MKKSEELIKFLNDLEKEELTLLNDYKGDKIEYIPQLEKARRVYNFQIEDEELSEELDLRLDNIMADKIRKLNPNFSEDIINQMLCSYKRGPIILPLDIFVIDDLVLHKEAVLDDWGFVHSVELQKFYNIGDYKDIFDYTEFSLNPLEFFQEGYFKLNRKEEIELSEFISNNINKTVNEIIVLPHFNTDVKGEKYVFGFDKGENRKRVFVNKNFYSIAKSIKNKEEADIKVGVLYNEDITLYTFHQTFNKDKPIWSLVNTNNEVWRLIDEIKKLENENINKRIIHKIRNNKLIDVNKEIEKLKTEDFEIVKIYHYGEITVCKTLEKAQRLYNVGTDKQKKLLDEVMKSSFKEITNFSDKVVDEMLGSYKLDLLEKSPVDILISGDEVAFKEFALNNGFIESIDYIFRGKKVYINEEETISLNSLIKENVRKLVKEK